MALTPGTRLGPYEVTAQIGVGGMGEVYRATDTSLKRSVAIKVLPASVGADAVRLARFQREAEVLAALNHPNIAQIHGLEKSDGAIALVMELVEGPTLADRIAQGAISIDEALSIAKQIAEALEAAHEQGIIHRDLKPANIKVRPDGTVKVLDFGLAKAMETAPTDATLTHSPTLSVMATHAGLILGTAAYMSPEQAKGFNADQRSDLFSFGCVLYEMLTGRQTFQGDTVSEVLASVLKTEADLTLLPATLNPRIPELLRRCLEKNPRRRWYAAGDVRVEIETILADPHEAAVVEKQQAARRKPLWRRAVPALVGMTLATVITSAAWWAFRPSPRPSTITRFPVTLGEGQQFANTGRRIVAISPDGTKMAYVANTRLYLRSMSDVEAQPITGTEASPSGVVTSPVFSPDGGSIAFWSGADQALKRIALTGGSAVTICPATNPLGITWGTDGIVFTQTDGIMRVSANGGLPERLVDPTGGGVTNSPQMLPDAQTLLFTMAARRGSDRWDRARIVVQSLGSGERKTLIEGGSHARYVPTGHLVYALGGVLFAVPFDLKRLEVTAGPVPIVEGVWRGPAATGGSAMFSVSDTGSLIYMPGPAAAASAQSALALIDRKGVAVPLHVSPGLFEYPRVSPDGTRLALATSDGKEEFVSIYELSGASAVRRLTFGGNNRFPIWFADGQSVAFQSDREGDPAVFWQPANGGTAERLTSPDPGTSHTPESWSPDGEVLLFSATKDLISSLWTFSVKDRKATPFSDVKGSSLPTNAMFSPDGRWVAYQIGHREIEGTTYVQPFPPTGTKYQVAQGGRPLWSRDGKELFFVPAPGRFMVATVRTTPSLTFTSPVEVPRGFGEAPPDAPRTFDIMPDGRIVGVVIAGQSPSGSRGPQQIQVVLNWFEELKRLVPTN